LQIAARSTILPSLRAQAERDSSSDLPKNAVIQSWCRQESLAQAAKQGFRGILSSGYYLDLMWPTARHYAVDPMSDAAANLNSEEQQRVLGGEACMWREYVVGDREWSRNSVPCWKNGATIMPISSRFSRGHF
jgi:hypothetical protein